MSDPVIQQLLPALQQAAQQGAENLLVLDENTHSTDLDTLAACLRNAKLPTLISNRYDLADYCNRVGMPCQFSDFDFSLLATQSLDNLFFRVAKEKPVNHHLLNSASQYLKTDGQLHLGGSKQEGIKSLVKSAATLLGDSVSADKQGNYYFASISRLQSPQQLLNDNQYVDIRLLKGSEPALYSKPGQFGWNKIDQGSALLAEQLPAFFKLFSAAPESLLDLGCGYGYLSVQAAQVSAINITATDNNAAAVLSCQQNFQQFNIQGRVVADNCGGQITELFDAVISHPPFHKGFKTDADLTRRFIQSACNRLKAGGKALMVANSFVPLEKFASELFSNTEVLLNNQQFKVVLMAR